MKKKKDMAHILRLKPNHTIHIRGGPMIITTLETIAQIVFGFQESGRKEGCALCTIIYY
jgi:hypothetical protein